ncbi:MAG: cupredoxin domain-containing protein, partial [Actinomycetota bacterium]
MRTSTRDRLVLPILLPVGILVAIAAILFAFSRILLSLPADAATATALIVAFAIMVVAGVAASRTHVAASTLASMVGVIAGVAMLAGGIALLAFGPGEEEAPDGEGPGVVVALSASDIAFDQTSFTVPAGAPFVIDFDNRDAGTQHNVQIFDNPDFTGSPLFEGDLVTGPDTATYEVDSLDPGTYYFNCVVHPQMQGTIEVREGPPGGGGGGGGGPTVDLAAQGIAFDASEIDLP